MLNRAGAPAGLAWPRGLSLFVVEPCPHGKQYDPDEKNRQEHYRPIRPPAKYPEHAVQCQGDERGSDKRAGQAFFCKALDV
jgi:hypothetical protein